MEKQFTAQLRYLRIAPRKVRLVANLVKGMSVNEAEAQLMVARKRPAPALLKLLRSAIANAKVQKAEASQLFIQKVMVNQGPMLKRFLPRARGSASPLQKKMSHVVLTLATRDADVHSRFTMVTTKKNKKASDNVETTKKKTSKPKAVDEKAGKEGGSQEAGIMKRVFRRKTAAA